MSQLLKMEISDYGKLTFKSIVITCEGEPDLNFNGGGYKNMRLAQLSAESEGLDPGIFQDFNDYIGSLSDEKQRALYECYARTESIFEGFDYTSNGSTSIGNKNLEDELRDIVKCIYDVADFDEAHSYVRGNTKLKIPAELSNSYTTDDKITSQYIERTYRLDEYIDLMTLCLLLRLMVPIWGPYLRIAGISEGMHMKEYHSFMLLRNSKLYDCRAFERMDRYIRANIDEDEQTMASALHFLSSEEIPKYAIAMTSIRKLSTAPISCETEKHHLMKIMYSYATNKIKSLSKTLEPNLHDKNATGSFEEDNSSVFCLFKMKEQITTGEKVVIQTYIDNYVQAAKSIDPTIDEKKVELCVNYALEITNWRALDVQKGLVSWTMSPVITGSTIPMLGRRHQRIAMGISQAILWHWGLEELAILVTARPAVAEENMFRRTDAKTALSPATVEKLDAIYPFKLPVSKNVNVPGGWSQNSGIRGIELFLTEFIKHEWDVQCDKTLARDFEDSHVTGFIETSPELREKLAELLIRLSAIVR